MITQVLIKNGVNLYSILLLIAYLIAILGAIILHELAHGYLAYKNGDMTAKNAGRLTLNPVKHLSPIGFVMMLLVGFGWAKPVPIDPRQFTDYKKGMIETSLAGVVCNLIQAIIASICLAFVLKIPQSVYANNQALFYFLQMLVYLFYFSMQVNILLMVFNLLPIYPLDGFRVVETLAEPNNKYVDFMYMHGNIVLIVFLLINYGASLVFNNSIFGMVNDLVRMIFNIVWSGFTGVSIG